MIKTRSIIQIDEELCDGCGQCVPDCAEGSLQIIDGKAKLVADNLCDGLGACLGACPQGALKIIGREAEDFDEEAVEEFLRQQKKPSHSGGCPSSQVQTFSQPTAPASINMASAIKPMDTDNSDSALSHWPVQIRLVPAEAPFLKGADLLIAADCSAVAAINFQGEYLQGKKVVMGCPKFDDKDLYINKFTEMIDKSGLNSITVLIMEVPCCSSMLVLLKEAVKNATKTIAIEEVILSRQGREISRKMW